MMRFVHVLGCVIAGIFCLLPRLAWAQHIAVVYSAGYKLDKSFNESAFNGVLALRQNGHTDIIEYTPHNAKESVDMLKTAAGNADHVITIGYTYQDPVYAIAPDYPKTRFTVIDGYVPRPNVKSIVFREEEGAFLAGIVAAKSSHSGIIGFIGGMNTPEINRFQAGYEAGARYASPKIKIISYTIGDDVMAFANPMRGYLLAMKQIQQGADVVFPAAGSSGLGTFQATEETARSAIGVDSDQNHLFPTTILTSMIKDVGKSLIRVVEDAHSDKDWNGKRVSMGLKENALYMSLNTENSAFYPDQLRATVNMARRKIIAGEIKVPSTPGHKAPIIATEPG